MMSFFDVFSTFIAWGYLYIIDLFMSMAAFMILLIFKVFMNTFEKKNVDTANFKKGAQFSELSILIFCLFNVSWTLKTHKKTAGCSDIDVQYLLAAV